MILSIKRKLRNFLCLYLCFSIAFPIAHAENQKASEVLEKLEKEMHEHFPTILSLSYDQLIQSEILRRFGDFHNAVIKNLGAVFQSGNQLQRVVEVLNDGSNAGTWSEKRFLSQNWTRYASQKILRDVEKELTSVTGLLDYWNNRCSKKYFEAYLAFYNPITIFPRDNFGPDIPFQKPPLYFGASVTVNDQGGTSGSASLAPQNEKGEAIVTTATVVGAVIGSYFGPLGTLIGGLIGSVIGSLINFFVSGFDAHAEHQKQKEIRERIRKFMIESVESLAGQREALFLNKCQNYLKKEENADLIETLKLLSDRNKELLDSAKQLNVYLEAEYSAFPEKLTTYLKDVELGYLNELSAKMTENQDLYLSDLQEVDNQSVIYQIQNLLPSIKKEQQARSALARLEARDELWQKKLVGDVLFTRTRDNLGIPQERIGPWKESSDYVEGLIRGAF